jgi:hypothetical protein
MAKWAEDLVRREMRQAKLVYWTGQLALGREVDDMSFVASFVLTGELYGVSDNNEIWRWDTDEAKWVKVGTIDRDG